MSERPDWLVPGGRAVLFTPDYRRKGCATIKQVDIERVLKRDVVLSDGTRLNADRRRIVRGDWQPDTELVSVDDPRIATARRANGLRRHMHLARTSLEDALQAIGWDPDSSQVDTALAQLDDARAYLIAIKGARDG